MTGTSRWLAGILLGLYLSLAAATDPVDVSLYQVIINDITIHSSVPNRVVGDESIISVEVDYTLIAPGGAEIEHPAGEDLPVKVELEYEWIWATNLADYNVPLSELVIVVPLGDNRYSVRYTEPGRANIRVLVTARVVAR